MVERPDDVIAIRPGIRSFRVHLESVGVRVADDIEPMLAPAFAVMRGGEKPIDGGGVVGLMNKSSDILRSGREAREVEGGTTQPRGGVGRRRPVEVSFGKLGLDESVEGGREGLPGSMSRYLERLETPVVFLVLQLDRIDAIGPDGAFIDPLRERGNLGGIESGSLGWHDFILVARGH